MKLGWLLLTTIVAGLIGLAHGWNLAENSVNARYVRSLAEKHEASARYWDIKTNEILTNNTLEAKRREKR